MANVEITSLSSRGQVVIPQNIRKKLKLGIGEKFIVIDREETIILKKIERPSFQGFDKLLKKTQEFAKKSKIKARGVEEAIRRVRTK